MPDMDVEAQEPIVAEHARTWKASVRGVVRREPRAQPADTPASAAIVEALGINADCGPVLGSGATDPETGRFVVDLDVVGAAVTVWVRARSSVGSLRSSRHEVVLYEHDASGSAPVLLALRDTVEVRGTAVDEGGRMVDAVQVRVASNGYAPAARCCSSEAHGEEDNATAAPDGTFSLRVRPGPFVVAVKGPRGVWSAMHAFVAEAGRDVDVGELTVPSAYIAVWDLQIRDASGNPVADGLVKVGRRGQWNMREHAAFDDQRYVLGVNQEGQIQLQFPQEPGHVFVGVGGPNHVTRSIALNCSDAGTHTAKIVLERRKGARIRLAGPGVDVAMTSGADLRIEVADQQCLSHEREAFDPSALVMVPVRRIEGWVPPAYSLEGWMALVGARVVARDSFLFYATHEGRHMARLFIGPTPIAAVEFSPSSDIPTFEMQVPPGHVVQVSLGALAASDIPGGRAAWMSRYCAWPYVRQLASDESGGIYDRGLQSITRWVDLYEALESEPTTPVAFWIPVDQRLDALAFGLLEVSREGPPAAVVPSAVQYIPVGIARVDVPTMLSAPRFRAERANATSVRFSVKQGGMAYEMSDIPLVISRADGRRGLGVALRGTTKIRTDEKGQATAYLLEGTYTVVGVGATGSGRTPFEIPAGSASVTIEVEIGD